MYTTITILPTMGLLSFSPQWGGVPYIEGNKKMSIFYLVFEQTSLELSYLKAIP